MQDRDPNKYDEKGNFIGGFGKGETWRGNANGRPKGAKNKSTEAIRQAYQKLTEDNLENMSLWLAQIAADNPEKALDMMIKLSEYVIPKLARTEVTGQDGEDLFKNIKFEFGPSVNDKDERLDE
jgi:hypothetical protein